MIKTIESAHNDTVKLAHKLQKKKTRRERGLFVAEGFDLLEAAVRVEEYPLLLLVREDVVGRIPAELRQAAQEDELDIGVCSEEVLARASGLGGAADVVAVHELVEWSLGDLAVDEGIVVYLHGVGDPGNVGTIVRGVVAFGAAGVACSPGTADPYGPKALRAGMGAQFLTRVVVDVSAEDMAAKLRAGSSRGEAVPTVIVADPRGEETASSLALVRGGVVLVLGSERGGLPDLGAGARRVAIAQARFDSLNVAMAATVLLYELSRGRLGKGAGALLA
ncbi:MAG: RNA methyltransferase [Thermoleophilia bacterium]|nr:RNA methyltransferase [Thermoleophilia bacterium]